MTKYKHYKIYKLSVAVDELRTTIVSIAGALLIIK